MTDKTHKNIHVALAAAQSQMAPLVKGAVNPHFKTKYADLASVVEVSRPALTENGISFHYEIRRNDGALDMVTVFTHGATETSIECLVPLLVAQQNMQGMKSATTYAKRIGHESLTGLAPEDDDGNDAAKNPPKKQEKPSVQRSPYTPSNVMGAINGAATLESLAAVWKANVAWQTHPDFLAAKDKRKLELTKKETE